MILVMGATGHIGSKITERLLKENEKVRCLARHFPNKDVFQGAQLVTGDANQVSDMMEAMHGCKSAFVMIPPTHEADDVRYYYNKIGEVTAEAIEESGIKKIVSLSSIGADLSAGTGPVLGLHDQEQRLNQVTSADITHLRPAYFMENLLDSIPTMISLHKIFGIVPGDAPIDMIATKDIAARAAFLLANPTFKSHNVEYLLGERTLSYNEVARVLGDILNKDLEYVEVTPQEMKHYLMGAGLSEDVVDGINELSTAAANGTLNATVHRDKTNTTPTSIEDFARTTFFDAYNKALVPDLGHIRPPSAPEAHP